MSVDSVSSGFLSNHSNTLDGTTLSTTYCNTVYGDEYEGGSAIYCTQGNVPLVNIGPFSRGKLSGYYNIRIFWDAEGIESYTTTLLLDVYEDGVKKAWTTGDSVDGEIPIVYFHAATTLGTRILLWFDPTKEYELVLRSHSQVEGNKVIVDYVKFEQLEHDVIRNNQQNSSEVVGGSLRMVDVGSGSVEFANAAGVEVTVTPWEEFSSIEFADLSLIDPGADYNSTLYSSPTPDNIEFSIRNVDGSLWTGTLYFQWMVVGIVELPVIRAY